MVALTGAETAFGAALRERLDRDPRCLRVVPLPGWLPGVEPDRAMLDPRHLRGVDVVVHTALLPAPVGRRAEAAAERAEVDGARQLLSAAAAAGVPRVVLWSQALVYGARPDNPNYLTESHPLRESAAAFVAARLRLEREAATFAAAHPEVAVVTLRTAALLSPGVPSYAAALLRLPLCPVLLGRDPLIQVLHLEDAVEGFAQAIHGTTAGAYNLASRGVLPYGTALALLGRLPLPVPAVLARRAVSVLYRLGMIPTPPEFLTLLRDLCVVDTTRAERELGYRPRHDIQGTLRAFAAAL